ncbi:MAG: GNAT family N-acetyltransferase [Deltaproteobacteria bacterium RIFOXYA12_FULL_58_15]|nr:MAG: GNAT family N-acetyltransferase [Deltaproteobacteria bacterium RIFOXYA12_FULL_58_15]
MATRIRAAKAEDAATIVRFIRELAVFEKADMDEVRVTAEDIVRFGFGDRRVFECLLAEVDGEPVGFIMFFSNFSTWEGRPGIYVEDLYVTPRVRGEHIGFALAAAVAKLAVERHCPRVDFSVLDWNPAREFYHRLGARHMHDWLPYRLAGQELHALAASGPIEVG